MTRIIHIKSREEWVRPEAYAPVDYDRSSLYRTEAESDRIEQLVRLVRKEMWQDRVKWFCVAVAVFAAVYFAAEFLR
jgi:hypothetical protein